MLVKSDFTANQVCPEHMVRKIGAWEGVYLRENCQSVPVKHGTVREARTEAPTLKRNNFRVCPHGSGSLCQTDASLVLLSVYEKFMDGVR